MSQSVKSRTRSFLGEMTALQRFAVMASLAMACLLFWGDQRGVTLALFSALCTTLAVWLVRFASKARENTRLSDQLRAVQLVSQDDARAVLISDASGSVIWRNLCASVLAARENEQTVAVFLENLVPNAASVVRRSMSQALRDGSSRERLIGTTDRVDLNVVKFGRSLIWRISRKSQIMQPETAETAMITVGRKGTILHMNPRARALIGARVTSTARLFQAQSNAQGGVRELITKSGRIKVHTREETLQEGRVHVFIEPIAQKVPSSEFALSDLPVPLLRLGLSGEIEQANEACLALLGYSKLNGLSMRDVFEGPGLAVDEWMSKTRGATRAVDAEFLRVKGADKETFVQVSLQRIDEADSSKIVAVLNDATKLKSLEAQFVQSQKMQAIGQLAGGVAHDFNNLLTAISGHCDLMLLRHDPGDQDYADLMQIHQNANRAAGLVGQLLAFSRKQTLQPEQLDLRNTLSDLTHLLNRLVGETVTLTLSHDPVLKPVRADKRQLEQVLMNLVVNARDAMPEGGEITIETESLTLSAPMSRERVVVPVGDYVVVRVRDVGIGIDAEGLQKIFEPFYTTKRTGEGTGLGLSTAYGIVKQTGGYIFADSEKGQGTCFSLLFPASEQSEDKPARPAEDWPRRILEQCSGVVLLVEDEAPVRAFASRALSMRGFDVIEADCAEAALELLKDTALHVDVFVTDVVMPGMDGPTWVAKALQDRPSVSVVFVSGYAEGAFQGGKPELENSVFLPKPFSLTELTSTVQNQLR